MTTATMRARYTGNKEICYRWVGVPGSGEVRKAQDYPGAEIVGIDTWSDEEVDARVKRTTKVRLPTGLLVIDSTKAGGSHAYAAGVLDGADPKNTINWSRAKHIDTKRVPADPAHPNGDKVTVHVVEVDGVRGDYRAT